MTGKLIVIATAFAALNVQALVDASLKDAYFKGADAKIIYRVVDGEGIPVEGASAHIWFRSTHPKLVIDDWTVNTDSNGVFIAEHRTNDRLSCRISKDGYYHTFDRVTFSDPCAYPLATGGKWQPYGSIRTVSLKKIRNPCMLHVFPVSIRGYQIPEFGKWIGFDFECCEWIAPYGKGRSADVLLRFSAMKKSLHDYKYVLDVSFTNNPYAGAYLMKVDEASDLKTKYTADSNATYKAEFSYVLEQSPGNRRYWNFLDTDSYLVFRTRTRVDKDNNLIGAHYGKILGRWRPGIEAMILSDGCFNPVENDVNIEDGTVLRTVLKNMGRGK